MSGTPDKIKAAVSAVIGLDSPLHATVCDRLQEELAQTRDVAAAKAEAKWSAALNPTQVVGALGAVAPRRTRRKSTSETAPNDGQTGPTPLEGTE